MGNPTLSPLSSLVDALLAPDQDLQRSLSIDDSVDVALQSLQAQRPAMLAQLAQVPLFEEAFPGTPAERLVVIEKLSDEIFVAAGARPPGSNPSAWFGVLKKLIAQSSSRSHAPLVEHILHRTASVVGEQRYLCMLQAHDGLQETLRIYQLQNRLSGSMPKTAALIAQEVAQASGGATGPFKLFDWAAIQGALEKFFEQWVAQPAHSALSSELAFLKGFLHSVVARLDLPQSLWLLLLMRLEVELSRLSPRSSHSFVSDVITPLIAGAGQLGVLGDIVRRAEAIDSSSASRTQLGELMCLQVVMNFSPSCRLAEKWRQALNISALHRAGIQAQAIELFAKDMTDSMRGRWERHELDVLGGAAATVAAWAHAAQAAEAITVACRASIQSMASQLIEGATDTQGQTRVAAQLEALLKVCIYSAATACDLANARALLRRSIALHLNTSRDSQVWKRHREIAARLEQIESSQPRFEKQLAAIAALAPELERVLSDQIKISANWLGLSLDNESKAGAKPAQAGAVQHGRSPEELAFTVARYAMFRRLHGEAGVLGAMNRWYCSYLFSFAERLGWKGAALALQAAADAARPAIGLEELVSGLKSWVRQLHHCAAARNLVLSLDKIAEATVRYGCERYTQRVEQGLAPVPPGGVEHAWTLGRLDCAWSLGRLSYVVASGLPVREQLWFWWQTGVGKNISRVPEPFIKAYLQSLSESLAQHATSEEADWVFAQLFDCYQRMFGLRQKEGNAELELFAPMLSSGRVWQKELGATAGASVFSPHRMALLKACPPALHACMHDALWALETVGDEEVYWQRQMPGLLALLEVEGSDTAAGALQSFRLQGTESLPLGTGALWHGFMGRCQQIFEQLSYGCFLAKNAPLLAEALMFHCKDALAAYQGQAPCRGVLEKLIARIGMTLMSEPPTMAGINLVRLVMWSAAQGLQLSGAGWHSLWLTLDATAERACSGPARRAAALWNLQLMACCDEVASLDVACHGMFSAEDLVLAETQSEELRWRMVLTGLLASACMPDHAPVNGKAVAGRLLLSCNAFEKESSASWSQRGQALLGLFEGDVPQALKARLSERIVQLGVVLYDCSRLRELPSVSVPLRYCVLMSGLLSARMIWRNALLARVVDEPKSVLSAEDVFIGNQLRESPPDAARASLVRAALAARLRYRCPSYLERKKLFGHEKVAIGVPEQQQLTQALRTQCTHDFLSRHETMAGLRECAALFAELKTRPELKNLLEFWLKQAYEVAGLAGLDGAQLRDDVGNLLAGSQLAQFKPAAEMSGAPAGALGGSDRRLSINQLHSLSAGDLPKTYLAASLSHLWQRPVGLTAWLFLSEEVLPGQWPQLQPRLQSHVRAALQNHGAGPASSDLEQWGQLAGSFQQVRAR